jgi:hypothetical protein
MDAAIAGDRNVIKKKAEKILKYKVLITEKSAHVKCESKSDTGNNRGDWNLFKITQTIPEQHNRESTKLRNCKKTARLGPAHVLRKVLM